MLWVMGRVLQLDTLIFTTVTVVTETDPACVLFMC
jgi:hypothetical protein